MLLPHVHSSPGALQGSTGAGEKTEKEIVSSEGYKSVRGGMGIFTLGVVLTVQCP